MDGYYLLGRTLKVALGNRSGGGGVVGVHNNNNLIGASSLLSSNNNNNNVNNPMISLYVKFDCTHSLCNQFISELCIRELFELSPSDRLQLFADPLGLEMNDMGQIISSSSSSSSSSAVAATATNMVGHTNANNEKYIKDISIRKLATFKVNYILLYIYVNVIYKL